MKNSITLLLLLCSIVCLVPEANGANYYWVGNGGSWNDLSHWASVSNGPGNAYMELPGEDDDVFFDNFSFTSSMQVVTISTDRSCLNLTWNNITAANMPTMFLSAGVTLNVYGKLDLDADMNVGTDIDNPGTIRMLANLPGVTYGVSVNGNVLPNIEFAGENGSWAITQDLAVTGDIIITAGEVDAGADAQPGTRIITADQFVVNGSGVALDISRMDITTNSLFSIIDLGSLIFEYTIGNTDYLSNITTPIFEVSSANATDFGSLNLTGTAGMLNASGFSIEFHGDVSLGGTESNTIFGSHTFLEDLILEEASAIHKLESGSTQTFARQSDIVADANCRNYFQLRSTIEGSEAFVDKSIGGPKIILQRFYIQDIHAIPDDQFQATISFDLGNTDGWSINTPGGITYYWVGGSGDWSDGNHWSNMSGGTPINCIPNFATDVVFDENSFPGQNETVTVDLQTIYFNNMTWTDPDNDVPTWSIPSGDILVGGSLTLAPSMLVSLTSPSSTEFHFVSTDLGNTIDAANAGGIGFNLGNVTFEGTGGWTLNTELKVSGDIVFNDGTFNTGADHNLEATLISLDGGTIDINFNTSEIFSTTFEVISYGAFDAGMSNIYTELFDITPSGMSFNEMILLGSEGVLRGDDITFVDVKLSSNEKSTVYGDHTYTNELQFDKPGMIVEFESGTTQQINILNSLGTDCGGEIIVRTTVGGSQVIFQALPGASNVSLTNVLLQDNLADPNGQGITFTAALDLGNNTGWLFGAGGAIPTEFYWVGGEGNWNDGANWSDMSGGLPINCIPTPTDNVNFDANSFDGDNQEVTLDGSEQYCRSMVWTDDVFGEPIMNLPAGNSLKIYGSLSILSGTSDMTLVFGDGDAAAIEFLATSTGHVVRTSGHSIPNLEFNGPGGGWSLNGAITEASATKSIVLYNGSLNTNGNDIHADQFLVDGVNAELTLGSSTLTLMELFQIINISSLDAGTSEIVTNLFSVAPTGLAFNEVQMVNNVTDPFDPDTDTEILADGLTFNGLKLAGTGNNLVHGSHSFTQFLELSYNNDALIFNLPITNFIFDGGSTQSFSATSNIFTSLTFPLVPAPNPPRSTLKSDSDTDVTFIKNGDYVCLENILIENIAGSGNATFGYNSLNAGVVSSPNWEGTVNCLLLPVECIDFAAAVKSNNSVELYWITAQEINNSGFEVQRSTDGRRFEAIGWVDGAGTTSEAQKYTFTDLRTEGLTEAYYRIKQIDFDGTSAFACDIQAVNFRQIGAGPMQVFPNPAGEQIQIRWFGKKTGSTLLRLFDQSGRLVLNREWNTLEGNNQRELPIAELPRGIYELQLVDTNGQTQGTRLIKQ